MNTGGGRGGVDESAAPSLRAGRVQPRRRGRTGATGHLQQAMGKLRAARDAFASRGGGRISADVTITGITAASLVSVLYKLRATAAASPDGATGDEEAATPAAGTARAALG